MKILFVLAIFFTSLTSVAQLVVYFEFNKHEVTPKVKAELDALLLIDSIDKINITGYTDSVGSISYNILLSKKRADAVSNYILKRSPNIKIITAYKGESVSAVTDAENRKVVIEIVMVPKTESKPENDVARVASDTATKVVKRFNFNKIYFQPSTANFKEEAYKQLEELYNTAILLTDEKLEIRGHINWLPHYGPLRIENEFSNLSLNRAKAVYQYLSSKGVNIKNISVRGMDNKEMVYKNAANQYEMEQNMRVEIVVVE